MLNPRRPFGPRQVLVTHWKRRLQALKIVIKQKEIVSTEGEDRGAATPWRNKLHQGPTAAGSTPTPKDVQEEAECADDEVERANTT